MEKCSTLLLLVDNRFHGSTQIIDMEKFNNKMDMELDSLLSEVEFNAPATLVTKTISRIKAGADS